MAPKFMNFGKYHNEPVSTVPTPYLLWCLRECECLDDWLRAAIEQELARRRGQRSQAPPAQTSPPRADTALVDVKAIISTAYREMAMRFHPDRGGTKEAMQAVNATIDRLRQLAGVA